MSREMFNWKSILFNVFEFLLIVGIGMIMDLTYSYPILIMVLFMGVRNLAGGAKHYKSPIKCIIWSTLIFFGIFLVAKVNQILGVASAIFCALILSKQGDLENFFLMGWKKAENSKYKIIDQYIHENKEAESLKEFERRLQKHWEKDYEIYYLRFQQKKSFLKIEQETGLDSRRITDTLDRVLQSFEIFFDLNPDTKNELITKN